MRETFRFVIALALCLAASACAQKGPDPKLATRLDPLLHNSIEGIMYVSGSSAFSLSNPLQRYWRDVHVGLRHVQNTTRDIYVLPPRTLQCARPTSA